MQNRRAVEFGPRELAVQPPDLRTLRRRLPDRPGVGGVAARRTDIDFRISHII